MDDNGHAAPTEHQKEVFQLLMKHHAEIFSFVMALVRDFSFADDVMQEMAAVICECWSDYRSGTNFCAWARQIARNKIYTMRRSSHQGQVLLSPDAIDRLELAANDRKISTNAQKHTALQKCMDKLEEKARRMISLRYESEMPCQDVAKHLQTSLPAVHKALSRIRVWLANCVRARLVEEAQ